MGRKSRRGEKTKSVPTLSGTLQGTSLSPHTTNFPDATVTLSTSEHANVTGVFVYETSCSNDISKPDDNLPVVVSDGVDQSVAQRDSTDVDELDLVVVPLPAPASLLTNSLHEDNVSLPPQPGTQLQTFTNDSVVADTHSNINSAKVDLLRGRLESISHKLINAQHQIDQLLEEKRAWLAASSANQQQQQQQQQGGELRGRWMQAVAQAEACKRERENIVVKYAQSEQRCMQLQRKVTELESRIAQSSHHHQQQVQPTQPSIPVDSSQKHIPASDELTRMQTRFIQTEKALTEARDQLEVQKKSQSINTSRVESLESKLTKAYESLRSEQRKVSIHQDTITRLNRSLDGASKQQKELERLRGREAERLCNEVAYEESRENMKQLEAEKTALTDRLTELDSLHTKLNETEDQLTLLKSENTHLSSLVSELDDCKQREDYLSEFTRRLTAQNTQLQAENLTHSVRLREAEKKVEDMERVMMESIGERDLKLKQQCSESKDAETRLNDLQSRLNHSLEQASTLKAHLDSIREESQLTHNRDVARIRDLVRQLSRSAAAAKSHLSSSTTLPRTTTAFNEPGGGELVDKNSLPLSPSSSVHSIESSGAYTMYKQMLGNTMMATGNTCSVPSSPPSSSKSKLDVVLNTTRFEEDERAAWLAKLDRLQRSQIRLTDKVEFLEEHCAELTEELNKKSQIIQLFVMSEKQLGTAAAAPSSVDRNKEQVIKTGGGLMASIFAGSASKSGPTTPDLETCLNVCQKLQSLFEDTLFKNITLKENLNTLGSEISSLNECIAEIRKRLCEKCHSSTKDLPDRTISSFHSPTSHPSNRFV